MFKPKADYILVKPQPRVASDIIEVVLHEAPNIGTVIAVGPGKELKGKRMPLDVRVGETVRFGEFRNMFPEYWEDGVKYLILQEADLAGIVEET